MEKMNENKKAYQHSLTNNVHGIVGLYPATSSAELLIAGSSLPMVEYGDMLWVSLLDLIPGPKGLDVQVKKRLNFTSHQGSPWSVG